MPFIAPQRSTSTPIQHSGMLICEDKDAICPGRLIPPGFGTPQHNVDMANKTKLLNQEMLKQSKKIYGEYFSA